MKAIPTYVHGILDYVLGIVLLLAPSLFGFSQLGGAPVDVARTVGLITIIMALFTNYELGLFKVLSMQAHLVVDYILGIFLAISPWLFSFNHQPNNVWMPHVTLGILLFVITLLTQTVPKGATIRSDRTGTPA
ncbi:MAG: hypothetical protein JWR26_3883 [Pedosphaera sp.]|nr:hypothetical protein [Pedosphaera sp.]